MNGRLSLKLKDLNEHLVCALCGGYFIDATTIIECLHSFCRSCIVSYLATNKCCPRCEIPAHKTRPLLNIRSDKTLQDVVYKLVPGLFDKEFERKRKFHQETGIPMDEEEKKSSPVRPTPEKTQHRVSLSLEFDSRELALSDNSQWQKENISFPKRYLRCYDAVSIGTLHKLIRSKLMRDDVEVIAFCRGEVLPETYTLADVAGTFSLKPDRSMSLTYMTFTTKGLKRKVLESIENEMEYAPPKKMAKESSDVLNSTLPEVAKSDSDIGNAKKDTDASQNVRQVQRRIETYADTPTSGSLKTVVLRPKLPTSQSKPQSNGNKGMSYSVMNVPLLEAVAAPVAEVSRQASNKIVNAPRGHIPLPNQKGVSGAPMQGIMPQTSQSGERPKSINSIANRLHQQIQMQTDLEVVPGNGSGTNVPDALKAANQASSSKTVSEIRSSWTPKESVPNAKMLRNQIAQHIYASTFQNRDRDEAEETLVLERIRQGRLSSPSAPAKSPSIPCTSAFGPSTAVSQPSGKFVQLNHSPELPNYTQATEQQRKIRHLQQQQQSRLKYHEIQPKIPVRLDGRQAQSQSSRGQKFSPMEDSQLISTTRQLASLRQQQKLLNEIAAAVAGRSTSLRTSESIRAAVSSLSPRMTSSRMPSSPRAPVPKKITSALSGVAQQRYSLASPKISPRMRGNHVNGTASRPVRPTGSSSFSEVPRLPPNVSYPAANNPREGGVDIYQNTIAKAKAEVREMSLKDRLSQGRVDVRTSASPYSLHRPPAQRKMTPPRHPQQVGSPYAKTNTHHVPIAPKPSGVPSLSQISSPPGYRPRLGHPTMPAPAGMRPPISRPMFPRPTTSPVRLPQAPPPAQSVPEQDQPLCLVVKK